MLLIDAFLDKMRRAFDKVPKKVNNPYLTSGRDTLWQAAELCDKIIFGESTMAHSSECLYHGFCLKSHRSTRMSHQPSNPK